ncbi:MAG: 3-oxoacyl-ACP reductase FabG [Clostridia bacterium]|nr:3-oxoacyl-ACP reductase FabG [Clostridia bacterium]
MKTVLITGAARGIGRAIARKFASEGYAVAINYNKSKDEAEQLKKELIEKGAKTEILCADVADADAVSKMVENVTSIFGDIDVLVNNAGIALPQGLFSDVPECDMKRVFDVDVFGLMNCTKAVIPQMVRRKSGKIINISSIWGVCGGSCETVYSAAKAAVIGFTKALAKELGPSGITVNCIAPGLIDTDMNGHLSEDDIDDFCQDVPLGRMGKPEDVANAVWFLASNSADYMTGQVLNVDGGMI